MIASSNIATVATPVPAYGKMADRWKRVTDIMGGTKAMREEGSIYFPQSTGESDDAYNARLNRCVLFNLYKDALDMLSGKVFSKAAKLGEKMDQRLKDLAEDDIDRNGRNLHRFARQAFYSGLRDRTVYILAEYPDTRELRNALGKAEGQPLTESEEKTNNIRPYLVLVDGRNVIEYDEQAVNGRKVLRRVRISESRLESDGLWGYALVEYVRVLEPGSWFLYRKTVTEGVQGDAWVLVDAGVTTLKFVPMIKLCFDLDREDSFDGLLPLETLLDLNLLHWSALGDLNNIIHFAQRYTLFGRCLGDEEPIKWGPSQIIRSENENADLKVVEHTGAAIAAGQGHVERLENRMRVVSAAMLVKRPGEVTATENSLDAGAQDSKLGQMVLVMKDCFDLAFQYLARWMGLDPEAAADEVIFNTEFAIDEEKFEKIKALESARARGDISQETFLTALKRFGVLGEDFDVRQEIQSTQKEQSRIMEGELEFQKSIQPEPEEEEKSGNKNPENVRRMRADRG